MKTRFCRVSPVVSVARLVTLAAAFVAFAFPASAGVLDDAKFILDLRGGENNYSKPGDLGNALDYSSAAPCVGYMGDFAGAKTYSSNFGQVPQQLETEVVNPHLPANTRSQNALHFFQTTKSAYGGARTSVCISNAAVNAATVTFYCRFKWEGVAPAQNAATPCYVFENGKEGAGSQPTGVALYIDGVSVSGATTNACLGFRGAQKFCKFTNLSITAGTWNDAFITFAQNSDNTEFTVTCDVCAASASEPKLVSASSTQTSALSFATPNIVLGGYRNSVGADRTTQGFRGAIAEFMTWERALTDDEKLEVMAGSARLGGEWRIGAANGSADEFGDADPADIYDVQSMPWRRMRKTLDSSHATLAIQTTMTADERQMSRTFSFAPILSGTGAAAPVSVSLNGAVVGEIDLASETSITLPKKLWLHDGGANTITITRAAPVIGTVRFDAVSLSPVPATSTVFEDAAFKLDLRGGESTYTKPGDVGNALDYSSALPIVGWMGDQSGPQTLSALFGKLTAQETALVRNPHYPLVVKERPVLHFYQENPETADGTHGVMSGVVFPGLAPQGDVQTFYLRFRWDGVAAAATNYPAYLLQSGNADNGNSRYGVAIMMDDPSVSEDGATTNVVVKCRVGRGADAAQDWLNTGLTISSGEWNDLFVTFSRNDGADKYTTTVSLCKTPVATGSGFEKAVLSRWSAANRSGCPQFNSANLTLGTYHPISSADTTTRCFRGLVADFIVWERALTDDEKRQVMNGGAGAKWFVGIPNGNADEFGDDNPASIYEPEAMPWHRMRKTLDAANPTLTLRCPVAELDSRAAKILAISPILRGGAEVSCPVAVSVNGTTIGTFDLANREKRCILVERALWTPDANGNATVTITRTGDVVGSLAIDHLSLCGSWQIGQDDGKSSMLDQTLIESSRGFVGDTEESRFCKSVSVGAGRASVFLDAWIPDGAEAYDWRFATDILNNYQTVDQGFTLYVNNTRIGEEWSLPAGNNAGEKRTWTIPAGTFVPGVNRIQLKMTTPASGTGWATLDYYQLRLVEPPRAFVVVVR